MEKGVKGKSAKGQKGKSKPKKRVKKNTPNPVTKFFKNEIVRILLGLFLGIAAIFTLLSLISFIYTVGKSDTELGSKSILFPKYSNKNFR